MLHACLGFPFEDSNAITNLIPEQLKITLKEALEQEPRLKELIETQSSSHKNYLILHFNLKGSRAMHQNMRLAL